MQHMTTRFAQAERLNWERLHCLLFWSQKVAHLLLQNPASWVEKFLSCKDKRVAMKVRMLSTWRIGSAVSFVLTLFPWLCSVDRLKYVSPMSSMWAYIATKHSTPKLTTHFSQEASLMGSCMHCCRHSNQCGCTKWFPLFPQALIQEAHYHYPVIACNLARWYSLIDYKSSFDSFMNSSLLSSVSAFS